MDAITLLKQDHKDVEKLFKKFEKAGPRAYVEKRKLIDQIIEDLSVHAGVEERLFYPATRVLVPDTEDIALESLEEHHVVKLLLSELQTMDPEDERFVAKATVLFEAVRHHVEEEEQEYFPMVREELGRKALGELGEAMAEARSSAPTRPHPHAPDEGTSGALASMAAGVADRVGDTVSGVAQGSVSAFRDLIDRMLDVTPIRSSPKGSRRARRTAEQLRSDADERLDKVIESIRRLEDSGRERAEDVASTARATAGAARRGAERTADEARRGANRTTSTARKAASRTARTARRSSEPAKAG